MKRHAGVLGLGVLGILLSSPVVADDLQAPTVTPDSYVPSTVNDASLFGIDEVRIGPAYSNLELPFWNVNANSHGRLDSIHVDVLFRAPLPQLGWGTLRPELGGVINVGGYESFVHAGLDWHVPLGSTPFYVEADGGVALHNGYLNNAPPGFHNLGCAGLFNWKLGAGWNISDHIDVTAQWEHVSNFVFGCTPNAGLNSAGLVVGWKF